ncbi:unnamed protein product [Strongylus vulgaris]|uniref:G-protein coupled receptors family 1 profile domain-containing protein n=1 Tax=Strongylus vulgaris TaxID=40348 RepID=A0A3P7JG60_STRVU|nr:unnamed protein product [Strongylus vulgaris]
MKRQKLDFNSKLWKSTEKGKTRQLLKLVAFQSSLPRISISESEPGDSSRSDEDGTELQTFAPLVYIPLRLESVLNTTYSGILNQVRIILLITNRAATNQTPELLDFVKKMASITINPPKTIFDLNLKSMMPFGAELPHVARVSCHQSDKYERAFDETLDVLRYKSESGRPKEEGAEAHGLRNFFRNPVKWQNWMSKVRSATWTLLLVCLLYLLSNLPNVIVTAWEFVDMQSLQTEFFAFYMFSTDLVSLLVVAACAMRLPIYMLCNPELRRVITATIKLNIKPKIRQCKADYL